MNSNSGYITVLEQTRHADKKIYKGKDMSLKISKARGLKTGKVIKGSTRERQQKPYSSATKNDDTNSKCT